MERQRSANLNAQNLELQNELLIMSSRLAGEFLMPRYSRVSRGASLRRISFLTSSIYIYIYIHAMSCFGPTYYLSLRCILGDVL